MNPDRLIGLSYVCERFHSGQWSRGYRLLSKIHFRAWTSEAANLLPREDWTVARLWAAHYTRWARKHPNGL